MPKFVTIGYGDETGYQRTDDAALYAAHAHDKTLREAGVEMGIARSPVQVRNHDDLGVKTEDGSFMQTALPLAGFAIIEADTDRDHFMSASEALEYRLIDRVIAKMGAS